MWVSFNERNPNENEFVITRALDDKNTDYFEKWNRWNNHFLKMKPIVTHWWDGRDDFQIAMRMWNKYRTKYSRK